MSTKFPRLQAAFTSHPWAIMQDRLEAICEVFERRLEGVYLSAEEIANIKGERLPFGVMAYAGEGGKIEAKASEDERAGSVIAVINVIGVISQHAYQVENISGPGGTSTERIGQAVDAAMADPRVSSVVFNIDSPGGSVTGVEELASKIYGYRGKKPMVAQVNSLMASAAYWIGAAAGQINIAPGAQAGSIGVYMTHVDVSKQAENEGVKFTIISAGKFKVDGNPYEPISETAAAHAQKQVNSYYSDFVSAVAKFRGVSSEAVRNGFGQGRVEKDSEAVKAGLADKVSTLSDTLKEIGAKTTGQRRKFAAMAVPDGISAMTVDKSEAGLFVVGDFPDTLSMARSVVDDDHEMASLEDDTLKLTFKNGSATYRIEGEHIESSSYICTLTESFISERIQTIAEKAAAGSDLFRRRKFALRKAAI